MPRPCLPWQMKLSVYKTLRSQGCAQNTPPFVLKNYKLSNRGLRQLGCLLHVWLVFCSSFSPIPMNSNIMLQRTFSSGRKTSEKWLCTLFPHTQTPIKYILNWVTFQDQSRRFLVVSTRFIFNCQLRLTYIEKIQVVYLTGFFFNQLFCQLGLFAVRSQPHKLWRHYFESEFLFVTFGAWIFHLCQIQLLRCNNEL